MEPGKLLHTFAICILLASLVEAKYIRRLEPLGEGIRKLTIYKEGADGSVGIPLCQGVYHNNTFTIGWDIFQVQTYSDGTTDQEQAECAGEVEGSLSAETIYYYYYNNIKTYCKDRKKACKKVKAFMKEHLTWLEKYVKSNKDVDIWYQASLLIDQIKGMHSGLSSVNSYYASQVTLEDLWMMNLQCDLDDVFDALDDDVSAKAKGKGHCSAIIKLLPGYTDLLTAHTTWTSYVQMNRVLKYYDMALQTYKNSGSIIPGKTIAFSGYPGILSSGDDFYISNTSALAVIETTIGNSNASLWEYVEPTGQIFESMRSVIAMRLATSGKTWSEIFSQYNSGTYNNQWMIVDYNKFTKGKKPKSGTLYILEQIPGYVRYADQTKVLKKQLYWPSYNIPFYTDVFNMSGNQELVDEYGDWFTYDKAPRAEIFKRDHSSVTDVDSLMTLMRSNNYKNDEYAKCDCTPPYSAENAIACRSDLNPKNGTYPFDALGHRCHGAIDAKIVNPLYLQNLTFVAVSGPTTGTNLPEFNWQTTDYKDQPHIGQPDSFTDFTPVVTPWLDFEST